MQYLQLVSILLVAVTYTAGQPCRICGPESPDRSCYPQDPMTPPEGVAIQSSICSDIENNHKDYHNQLCEKYTKPNGYYFECTSPGTTNTFSCRSSCGPPLEDVGKGLNLDLLQGGGLFASLNQNRPQNRGAGLFDFANFNNDKGRGDTNFGNFATIGNFNLLANQNPAFGGSRGNFQNQGPISGGIAGGLPQQPAGPPPLNQVRPLGQLPPNPAKLPGHFPAQPLGEFPNFPQPTLNRGFPQGQNQGNAFPQQQQQQQQQQNPGNTVAVQTVPSQANTFTPPQPPPQQDPQGPPGIQAPLEVIDFTTKVPENVNAEEQSGPQQETAQNAANPSPVQNIPPGASGQGYPNPAENTVNLNNPDAQNIPSAAAGQINPDAAPAQNLPNPASVQNIPSGASGPEYPNGVPPQTNPIPVPGGPNYPQGQSGQVNPDAMSGQNYQNGAPPQNNPGEVSGQNLANQAPGQNYPGEPANQNNNPNGLSPQNYPSQQAGQNYPNQLSGQNVPSQQAGQNYPNQALGQAYPNQPSGQNYPNQPAGQNYPNQPSGQNYPNQPSAQNYPNQPSGQNYPNQQAGQNYPNQQAGQNEPSQQAGQNYPNQALGQAYPNQQRPLANPQQNNNLQPPLGGNQAPNYPEQPSVNSALPSVSIPNAESPQQPGPGLPPQQPPYPVDLSSDEVYPPGEGPNPDSQPLGRYTDASGPNVNPGLSGGAGNRQGPNSQQDYPVPPQSPNPADPNAYPADPQAPNNAGYPQDPQDYAARPQDGPSLGGAGDQGAGGSDQYDYSQDSSGQDYSGPRQPLENQGPGSYEDPQASADEFAASSNPQAAADEFAASSDPQGALDAYKSARNDDGSGAVELARQRETEDPAGSGSGGPLVSVGDERDPSSSDGRAPGLFDVPGKSPGSSSSSSSFSDPQAGHTDNLPPEAFRNPFKNPASPFSKRTDQFESNPAFVGTSLIGEGFLDSPDSVAAPRPRGPDAVDIGGYALFPGFKDFEQTGVADALGTQKNNEQQNNIFSLFTSPTTTLPGQGRPSQGGLLGRQQGQVANGFSVFSPQASPSTQTGGGGIFSPYFLSSPGRTDFLTPTQRRLSGPPYNQVPTNNAAVTGFPGQANNIPAPFPANPNFPNTARSTQPNFRGPQPQSGTNPFLNAATGRAPNPGTANDPRFPNTGANNPAFQNPNPAPAGFANFRNTGSFPANPGTAVFPPFGSTTSGQPGFAAPPSTNPGPDGFPPFGSTASSRGSFPSRTGTSSGASGFPSTTASGAPRASQTGRSADFGFGSTGNTDGFGFPGSFGSFNDNGFNNNNGFDKDVFSDDLFNDKNAKQESSDETISTAPSLTEPVPQSNSPN